LGESEEIPEGNNRIFLAVFPRQPGSRIWRKVRPVPGTISASRFLHINQAPDVPVCSGHTMMNSPVCMCPGIQDTIADGQVHEIRDTGMRFHGIVTFVLTMESFSGIEREACAGKMKLLKGTVHIYRPVFLIYPNDSPGFTPSGDLRP
jgi:hypothetical protein